MFFYAVHIHALRIYSRRPERQTDKFGPQIRQKPTHRCTHNSSASHCLFGDYFPTFFYVRLLQSLQGFECLCPGVAIIRGIHVGFSGSKERKGKYSIVHPIIDYEARSVCLHLVSHRRPLRLAPLQRSLPADPALRLSVHLVTDQHKRKTIRVHRGRLFDRPKECKRGGGFVVTIASGTMVAIVVTSSWNPQHQKSVLLRRRRLSPENNANAPLARNPRGKDL